jgi:hypothetical protein
LKKRSKKHLHVRAAVLQPARPEDQSFLVLFFKKEHFACCPAAGTAIVKIPLHLCGVQDADCTRGRATLSVS